MSQLHQENWSMKLGLRSVGWSEVSLQTKSCYFTVSHWTASTYHFLRTSTENSTYAARYLVYAVELQVPHCRISSLKITNLVGEQHFLHYQVFRAIFTSFEKTRQICIIQSFFSTFLTQLGLWHNSRCAMKEKPLSSQMTATLEHCPL